ncbi:acyloxyacyl hydrolase [Leadbetterella byssophila]|nr:acyloxyacyl hydrolase [Leadbetterella byssophila]
MTMCYKKLLLLILLPQFIFAQLSIEVETENGGMLTQKSVKSTTYEDAYYNGINARVGWKSSGKKDHYHQIYNYPVYGIGFYSSTFNSDIIGNPFALYGFVDTPISPKSNSKWGFDYRIGLGLSGNFNPYDEDKNPLNLVIGSKTNVFIDFGLRTTYRWHEKWKVGAGFSFHHFSNGSLSLPNKGINLVPFAVTVIYEPKKIEPYVRPTIPDYPKNLIFDFSYGSGVKQLQKTSKERFWKSTVSLYASKYVSHKWRLGGGYDFFYSQSGKEERIAGQKAGSLGAVLTGGPSLYIVHHLTSDLTLNGNVGYYLHKQSFNGELKRIFLRAGARYYFSHPFNAGVSIKAHAGKADYIEWTIGYTLKGPQ